MLRLGRPAFWAVVLGVSAGCASIDGKPLEPVDEMKPDPTTMDAGQDAGGGNGNQNGNGNAPPDAGPVVDAGNGGSAGDGGSSGEPDADVPPPVPNGTCAAPYALTLANGKASATGDTTGKMDTISPKCGPGGLYTPVPGPDHVYRIEVPFKGRVVTRGTSVGGFIPSVYLLTNCGNSPSEKACNYLGETFVYSTTGPQTLFVYVDSGAGRDIVLGLEGPKAGAYQLNVSAREESAVDGACGALFTQPYCGGTNVCRAAKCVAGTVMCGDGFVEGAEECDGTPGCTACKLGTRETCAAMGMPPAGALTLRPEGHLLVARAAGDTTAAVNDVDPGSCATGNGRDHVYSFTLAERASVKLDVDAKFDAVIGISGTACGAGDLGCVDGATNAGVETYSDTLNAGTYFVTVDAYTTGAGTYDLVLTVDPTP